MGPVSFELIHVEGERSKALALAADLRRQGIRVESLSPKDGGYALLIRSADAEQARLVMLNEQSS